MIFRQLAALVVTIIPTVGAAPATKPATKPATTAATTAPAKPQAATRPVVFNVGQKAEVKWGLEWRNATVKGKANGWTLVAFEGGSFLEWVEPWRLRKPGSTEDPFGYVHPNDVLLKPQAAPTQKPGPPPGDDALAASPGAAMRDVPAAEKKADALKTTEFDRSALREVKPGVEPIAGPWALAPDPVPAPAKPPSAQPIELKNATDEHVEDHVPLLIAPASATAVVIHLIDDRKNNASRSRVDRISLATRASVALDLPVKVRAVDISPDGKRLLTQEAGFSSGESRRLDVWQIDGTRAVHVVSFLPYGGNSWASADPTWARFVGDNLIATTNWEGRLIVWDVAVAKALWSAETNRFAYPSVSGGRKYLAAPVDRGTALLDPATGKTLAVLVNQDSHATAFFSPDGKQVALLGSNLRLFSMESGEPITSAPMGGMPAATVDWVNDGYLLLGRGLLFDVSRQINVWSYDRVWAATSKTAAVYAGRLWYVVPIENRARTAKPVLASVVLPHAEAKKASSISDEELYEIRPGVKMSLELHNVPAEDLEKARAGLTKRMTDNGFVVADGQPYKLVATMETGKSVEMSYVPFAGGEETKVSVNERVSRVSIVGADGQPLWETRSVLGPPPILTLSRGQTIEQALAEWMMPNTSFLMSVQIPKNIPKAKYKGGLGSTTLTERGIAPAPPPRPAPKK